jgi:hypothetical protein
MSFLDAFPVFTAKRGGIRFRKPGEVLTPEERDWEAARMKARVAEQQIRTETVHEYFAGLSVDRREGLLLEFLYDMYDKGRGPFWCAADDL